MHISSLSKTAFLLLLLAIPLFAGCAPMVTQEQYSSLQVELKTTKDQLAAANAEIAALKSQSSTPVQAVDPLQAPRKTLASMQPYIELNLLILDDMATISQQNSKDITIAYANQQFAEHRSRLATMLQRFDDKTFANTVAAAWNENTDPQLKWQDWYQTYSTVSNNLKGNMDKLSGQLNP